MEDKEILKKLLDEFSGKIFLNTEKIFERVSKEGGLYVLLWFIKTKRKCGNATT